MGETLKNLQGEAARLDGRAGVEPPPVSEPSQGEQGAQQVTTAAVLAPILRASFNIITPAWKVTDEEVGELAGAYGEVVDEFFPGVLLSPRWQKVLNAAFVSVAVFGPRWEKPRTAVKATDNKPAPQTAAAPSGLPSPEKLN